MASVTQRGKAVLEGIAGTFDVIIYPLQQTVRQTATFEEEIIKDVHGFDTAWSARNFHYLNDFGFKLIDQSTPSTRAHADSGAAILAPYATVTLTLFEAASLNGVYQNVSGQEINLANVKVGDMSVKLRRYDDSGQNTIATTIPT